MTATTATTTTTAAGSEPREATSPLGVPATAARVCEAARGAGMGVFARVDHAAGARDAGLELGDEVLLVLGAPAVGTLLMQADRRAGLDLPLRVLVWDDAGTTRVTWHDPRTLAAAHELPGLDPVLDRMAAGLAAVVDAAGARA